MGRGAWDIGTKPGYVVQGRERVGCKTGKGIRRGEPALLTRHAREDQGVFPGCADCVSGCRRGCEGQGPGDCASEVRLGCEGQAEGACVSERRLGCEGQAERGFEDRGHRIMVTGLSSSPHCVLGTSDQWEACFQPPLYHDVLCFRFQCAGLCANS